MAPADNEPVSPLSIAPPPLSVHATTRAQDEEVPVPSGLKAVQTQVLAGALRLARWLIAARWTLVKKVASVATCVPLGSTMGRVPWLSVRYCEGDWAPPPRMAR